MTSSKRLRVGSGSTTTTTATFKIDSGSSSSAPATAPPPQNPNKCMKSPSAFFISTPPLPPPLLPVRADQQPVMTSFLEKCYYCGKKISPEEKIFMYRDFCAFCSEECREIQIARDELEAKQRAASKATTNLVAK